MDGGLITPVLQDADKVLVNLFWDVLLIFWVINPCSLSSIFLLMHVSG
jgi:hypothetical protein